MVIYQGELKQILKILETLQHLDIDGDEIPDLSLGDMHIYDSNGDDLGRVTLGVEGNWAFQPSP